MGEYAEAHLDGTCCEACGEYLGGAVGYPRYCSKACSADRVAPWKEAPAPQVKKTACPECGRRVKIAGLKDHLRDVHGAINKLAEGAKP